MQSETLQTQEKTESGATIALYRAFSPVAHLFRAGAPIALLENLTSPRRCYHNLHHVLVLLRQADPLWQFANNPEALRIAILFHDAVYQIPLSADLPTPRDNEERSIRLMAQQSLNPTHPSLVQAAELIRTTIPGYESKHTAADGALMHDLDLSILAGRLSRYLAFEQALRAEYAAYPDALYCSWRLASLKQLIERQKIYKTNFLAAKWESKAQENIRTGLSYLAAGKIPNLETLPN